MNCIENQEQIHRFIDGELQVRTQTELFKHLASCEECQAFIDIVMKIREAGRDERIPYPAELDDAIVSGIRKLRIRALPERETASGMPWWKHRFALPVPWLAAAVLALFAIGMFLGNFIVKVPEANLLPVSMRHTQVQPAAVIIIYGMSPVDVIGTTAVKTVKNNSQL